MRRVAVIVHQQDRFEQTNYFLRFMTEIWRERGVEVTVVRDARTAAPADLAILHVDLTVVPPEYQALADRYPLVINGRATDISKRHISSHIVRRGDGYSGPVIVKSNFNYGGLKERDLIKRGSRLRWALSRVRNKLPWSVRSEMPHYRVLDSARDVPRAVWYNPDLVVEQFLPEQHDGFYCNRTWMFLGDRDSTLISYSKHPVVNGANVLRREIVPEPPEELRRIRDKLGFSYGKFDYTVVDGQVTLYDTNRTPTWGPGREVEHLDTRTSHLAEGLWSYFE